MTVGNEALIVYTIGGEDTHFQCPQCGAGSRPLVEACEDGVHWRICHNNRCAFRYRAEYENDCYCPFAHGDDFEDCGDDR